MADWFNDDDYVEWSTELLEGCPEPWDGDESQESIILRYVGHLRDEVIRLGGCLLPFCGFTEGEPCDHGHLPRPASPPIPLRATAWTR
jgi:hypothetical protein